MRMGRRVRVLLLFGGRSAEHDVSRMTAVAVARALDPAKYDVVPVAITTEGAWLLAEEARALLASSRDALPAAFAIEGAPVDINTQPGGGELVPLGGGPGDPRVDVVLPLLHGPYGEDGTIQGLLDTVGLPYVGSGVLGSAVGMDKVMMKRAFLGCGLPTPRFLALREGHPVAPFCREVERELGLPCFVKPANMGSSVGVSKARDRAELEAAIELALAYDEWLLAEEAVTGREIEVAVLGDDPPEASVPGEVVPAADFYDYADKYEDGRAQLLAPAPLSEAQATDVRRLAVAGFEACRCEAMARVDFFLEETGPARGFLLNELNTIPGFTPISMYPRLWQVSGVTYPELIDRLIRLAIERHQRRAARAGRQRPVRPPL
ncbi:MAG TPA: D-alanine--D-alanine ligase family protein [Kofleriaceae bacterium]|nr:D-alanine--D-alanine ligase family protein [Kofleriaceae bacterium]